ncbi:putative transmembrane protein [Sinorhizobium fredii NGR234]|uniref:Transmembrane protein n=1 Tax=Sinorhizobium fredii (strain NBRC 101917 / NGR234) TaxID=394 RepID=C3MAM7_SINFN|nr:OpgC domain-containing protein [Sinorhizobium fredii]ACP27020.1 putative transmembrane protein [Sinorhizobium fredii NGR234]
MLQKTSWGVRDRIGTAPVTTNPVTTNPVTNGRDTRLDVFRALCLLTIFVNHVPGQYLEYLTHKNIGFSDSAEAFVLISGLSVGVAYGGRFVAGQRLALSLKIWRRALTLYVAHIMTSVVTLAIFAGGALYFGRQDLIGEINIRPIVDQAEQGIVAMVLLGHQLGYNNILSMYAVLFLMLPGLLWLNALRPSLLFVLSAALWLAAGCFKLVPYNFLDEGYWFLNPWSWQFLFVIGILAIGHVRRGGRLPRSWWLIVPSAAYLLVSGAWVLFSWWSLDFSFGLPAVLTGFDKTFLSLTRLLHVLALAYLLAITPLVSRLTRLDTNHPLVMVGRHSLAVFIFGTILAMAGQVLLFVTGKNPIVGSLFVVAGIGLHFVYAYYLDWLREMAGAKPLRAA